MTSATIMNPISEDGILLQHVVRRGLIAMALAIIFLSGAALWTVVQLTDFYKNKVHIITEQENLLSTMRLAARERTLLLYSMVVEEDPFQRDDLRMAFYGAGAKFALARIKLVKSPLVGNELPLVEEQGVMTSFNGPAQEQVLDLVINDQIKVAVEVLREQANPGQQRVMQILDQLNNSINKRYNKVKAKANSIGQASIMILITIVIIIVLGAVYIIGQTTYRTSKLISQLTKARKILQQTNNELVQQKDTLDHHAIVSIADREGNITYVNDKFCDVSGFSRDELLGKNHSIVKSDVHSIEFYHDLWSTIKQGKVWHGVICNQKKNGGHYWVESTISPFLDSTGKPYQYVSIRTDITRLLDAKIDAEKANQAKSTFLSSMSHELRTPMNAVLGFAQILEKDLDADQLDSAKEISKAGNYLLTLINEILDLSKIEVGSAELCIEEVDIEVLINECLKMVENMAHDKKIKLHLQIQNVSNVVVIADRLRLKQALLNYLSNAIKFNRPSGAVTVNVKSINSGKCLILVEDRGAGLSEEQCSIIFNPFTKLDKHLNLVEGSGIGLTITKRLIEMMNGNVGVESEVGSGSTFWIELPMAE